MQSGVSRLAGNLDGIVLYSGKRIARSRGGNEWKRSEGGTGRLYAAWFTKALHNFSEFLLTGKKANISKTRSIEQELQTIEEWKIRNSQDPEPQRRPSSNSCKNLRNPRPSSMTIGPASSRWCSRGRRNGLSISLRMPSSR